MKKLLTLAIVASCLGLFAQDKDEKDLSALLPLIKQIESKLHFQKGEVALRGDLAKLTVPENLRYLNAADTDIVLTKLWGNPPSHEKTLGMLLPVGVSLIDSNTWGVVITYAEDGYVKDAERTRSITTSCSSR